MTSSGLGQAKNMKETKDLQILVIGYGSIGKRHSKNLKSLGVEKISIVDPEETERKKAETELSSTTYAALTDAFNDGKSYDGVVVGCPTAYHISSGKEILKYHKGPIFMEKPLSHNLEGVEEFLKQADENGQKIMVGYSWRYWKPMQKAKELIEKGEIGRPIFIDAHFSENVAHWHPWQMTGEENEITWWMGDESKGGGVRDECHVIDFARFLLGDITEVSGKCSKISDLKMKADDFCHIRAHFAGGAFGNLHMDTFGNFHRKYVEVVGSKANLYIDFYDNTVTILHSKNEPKREKFDHNRDQSFIDESKEVINLFKGQSADVKSDGWDGLKTLKVFEAARESTKQDQKLIKVE